MQLFSIARQSLRAERDLYCSARQWSHWQALSVVVPDSDRVSWQAWFVVVPDNDRIDKRAGALMQEFKDLVYPENYVPGAKKRVSWLVVDVTVEWRVHAWELDVHNDHMFENMTSLWYFCSTDQCGGRRRCQEAQSWSVRGWHWNRGASGKGALWTLTPFWNYITSSSI